MVLGAQLEIVGMAIALSPLVTVVLPYSLYLFARLIIDERKLNKEEEQD